MHRCLPRWPQERRLFSSSAPSPAAKLGRIFFKEKKFTTGGKESRRGWLQDKYGLSWQIIPTALGKLLSDPDPEKSSRVMKAMQQMSKIEVKASEQAHDGGRAATQ